MLREFPAGAPFYSHSLKDMLVRCIGHAKFSLCVPEQVPFVPTRELSLKLHCSVNVSLIVTLINLFIVVASQ